MLWSLNVETSTECKMAAFREDLEEILTRYFPDYKLRESQGDVLEHLYNGRGDCLVSLPTGYGKSFIFQAAGPLLGKRKGFSRGSALVICPLNVIQRDQMLSLAARGISSCRLDINGRATTYREVEQVGKLQDYSFFCAAFSEGA